MRCGSSFGATAFAICLILSMASAKAQDMSKYPAFEGGWTRGSSVGTWDPTKPPGLGQQAPLKPEYRAVHEANIAKTKAGVEFDPKATCGPVGMPRVMAMYEPMEIIIKPDTTWMLLESMSPLRRIHTDGRDWPKDPYPSWVGYSIGKWLDTTGNGRFDTLEIETRHIAKGPRHYDGTGIPFAEDNATIVKERLYLDKTNPGRLVNEITTIDNALTRPWTVSRFYRRDNEPESEYACTEDNRWVVVGGRMYMTDADGYFMPITKDQPAPDLKYFQKHFKQPAK